MKNALRIGSVIIASLLPVAASAGPAGPYVSFLGHAAFTEESNERVGGVPVNVEFDTGFGLGTALGYAFAGTNIRLEGEITYRYNEAEASSPLAPGLRSSGDIDSLAYMANAYYDFNTGSTWTPYVGGGMGVVDIDGDDAVFAYQGMLGVAMNVNDRSAVTLGYRYFGSEGLDELEYASHSAEVGYRIHF